MGAHAWITLALVAGMLVVLARDWTPPSVAVFATVVALLLAGVVDAGQALAGFANPAPWTVAALYVLARAVQVTGALDTPLSRLLTNGARRDGDGHATALPTGGRTQLARLAAPAALASGALNNTTIVAMGAPQVVEWAARRGRAASRLLMPLSFAAILGGLLTAIGTSTNLVVSGLLERAGRPPMGMFEITAVGAPLLGVGLLVLIVAAPRLLPTRRGPAEGVGEVMREFTVAMRVQPGGALDGTSVAQAELRDLQGVFLVELERDGQIHAPVTPQDRLSGGDLLTFAGKVDQIVDLQRMRGLEPAESHHAGQVKTTRQRFFEAVVGPDSHLVGHTLKDVGFRGRYGAAVLAIHRAGERVDAKLGEVALASGDTLLVVGDESFERRWRESQDFLLVASLGEGRPPARHSKAPWVLGIAAALIASAAAGVVSILEAALVAAFALVAVGAVSLREARDAVDLNVIVIIAAAFGIGEAMRSSGLADQLASLLLGASAPLGDVGVLVAILVATVVLTELVTNNAAAVLMFPIAAAAADAAGVELRPLAMGVAVAASASFLTPIGYQTNTMVYGLGGYRFSDFARLGAPLTVVVLATATALIPRVWPL